MRVIHIVDNLGSVNIGIWKAAISATDDLITMGCAAEIWFPAIADDGLPGNITAVPLTNLSIASLQAMVTEKALNKETDIIVTHGCWQYPTRWGSYLAQQGFAWIYTPHGMLEPWPMRQKYLKKKIYFLLMEKRMAERATAIRAVSLPEQKRLSHLFSASRVEFIPNGVHCATSFTITKPATRLNFVFMARLHHKKGITPLVKAWTTSSLANNMHYRLQIAGPDEGELAHMRPLMQGVSNIEYLGMVSGKAKEQLLAEAHYYLLPSFSEGFPTSILEAMEKGAIPVITKACNFEEVFDRQLGYEITAAASDIRTTLQQLAGYGNYPELQQRFESCYTFIKKNYTLQHIAALQYQLFAELLQAV